MDGTMASSFSFPCVINTFELMSNHTSIILSVFVLLFKLPILENLLEE